ncbi:zinc finger protein JACKDAW-like, partial [Trifolium medium]|nr:zinc finger protein JACKDAW-like [Trifolium medium]
MATNRFICEICNKGFQRDQNLQLHRRGHNLPWKLRQRSNKDVIKKKVYICPEKTCVHHDPSRALGDLTVQSDWKAHTKTCGTREYKCDCGTLFS